MRDNVVALSDRKRSGRTVVAREGDELVAIPYALTARRGVVELAIPEGPHPLSPEQARMLGKDLIDMAEAADG